MYFNTADIKKKLKVARVGNEVFISKKAKIIYPENLFVGKNVRIDDNVILICKKPMHIGSNIHIAPNSIIRSHAEVFISDFVLISSFVDIFSATEEVNSDRNISHPMIKRLSQNCLKKKIVIEKYSFIGSHSVILPDAYLSEGTFVGALTLINFKTKKWNSYIGNPARIIGQRDKNSIVKQFLR
jgi:acetyltransferase-like isoleucine patch superfamily enzyme